jgi:hypothetical protein
MVAPGWRLYMAPSYISISMGHTRMKLVMSIEHGIHIILIISKCHFYYGASSATYKYIFLINVFVEGNKCHT